MLDLQTDASPARQTESVKRERKGRTKFPDFHVFSRIKINLGTTNDKDFLILPGPLSFSLFLMLWRRSSRLFWVIFICR